MLLTRVTNGLHTMSVGSVVKPSPLKDDTREQNSQQQNDAKRKDDVLESYANNDHETFKERVIAVTGIMRDGFEKLPSLSRFELYRAAILNPDAPMGSEQVDIIVKRVNKYTDRSTEAEEMATGVIPPYDLINSMS